LNPSLFWSQRDESALARDVISHYLCERVYVRVCCRW
jgi:hypothetical protein